MHHIVYNIHIYIYILLHPEIISSLIHFYMRVAVNKIILAWVKKLRPKFMNLYTQTETKNKNNVIH